MRIKLARSDDRPVEVVAPGPVCGVSSTTIP
jgi:hypothetical protein